MCSSAGEYKHERIRLNEWYGLDLLELKKMKWPQLCGITPCILNYLNRNGSIHIWDVDKTEIIKTFTGLDESPRGLGIIRENKSFYHSMNHRQ